MEYKFNISENDIQICKGALIEKKYFNDCLNTAQKIINESHPECKVMEERSRCSLKLEWSTHNFCYLLGIKREETLDVDLNIPQSFWIKVAYAIVGCIGWIFIK